MKKLMVVACVLFLFSFLTAQEAMKFLQIDPPAESAKGKNRLAIPVASLEAIINAESFSVTSISVELTDAKGNLLTTLAKVDKNKIKWAHKLVDKTLLLAEFNETDYPALLEKVKAKVVKPGLQLLFRDPATGAYLKSYEILFANVPELIVSIEYPFDVEPGESLQGKMKVSVNNRGVATANQVSVEVFISKSDKIQVKKTPAGDTFSSDGLLLIGRQVIPAIEPGKTVEVVLEGNLKIPENVQPQRAFMAVVVDPENQIAELNEDNNTFRSVLTISVQPPKKFTLNLPETRLVYEPKVKDSVFNLSCQGILLSDGKEWRVCRIKPFFFQMKPRFEHWKDYHWAVDTFTRRLYEVRGAEFCKMGGQLKTLKLPMEVKGGGSASASPRQFTILFTGTQIVFEPEERKFSLLLNGAAVDYPGLWQVVPIAPHRYQIRYRFWQDYFLEVDTYKKVVLKINSATYPLREIPADSPVFSTNLVLEK